MSLADPSLVLARLTELLGADGLLTEDNDRARYEEGWRYGKGRALAVARPKSAAVLAEVLRLCDEQGVRVQPMGANTGLVGASNPDATGEQIVVSLERLTSTIEIDPIGRTVLVDAGVTLSQLNEALAEHDLFFPIDLGADPQIGGMIATNTGGTRLLRYGPVRAHVLGLEVVTPDGRVFSDLSFLRKDNRGLDLKQLFIGTSGTFGIITRAVLSVAPKPKQTVTAWAALTTGDAALALLAHLERNVGSELSAYEVLSQDAFEVTLRHGANVSNPFGDTVPAFAALLELSTTLPATHLDLDAVVMATLEEFLTQHPDGVEDVVPLPKEEAWNIRHQVSESLRHEGQVLALDVSVPRSRIAAFTAAVRAELTTSFPTVRVCDFGHWGDGGTHLNLVYSPSDFEDVEATKRAIRDQIYTRCVNDYGGSYSAEHGVGPYNHRYYEAFSSPLLRTTCAALKNHFDPHHRCGTVDL